MNRTVFAKRDDLQRRAMRLVEEQFRLLKAAKAAAMPERAHLARQAMQIGADAQVAIAEFQAWRPA